MSNEIYHFEPVEENEAGFSLNKRVVAVYQLAGFIHQSYRNHSDYPQGKPIWSYVERGGKLTGIESSESAEALQAELSGEPTTNTEAGLTHTIGAVQRLFIGLHKLDGAEVSREAIIAILANKLDTFTVTDALGYYQGEPEPTLIAEVPITGGTELVSLAQHLADTFNQDAVGVEKDGIYTRVFGKRTQTFEELDEDEYNKSNTSEEESK
ncbi:MAG: hypothetical protein P8R37_10470 [Opitutae bacterium]|nr:hypothetical protein [Opitutae bacterium]